MHNRGIPGSHRVGWLIVGVLAVGTAGWGVLDPGLYRGLIAPATRPGALSQDAISLIAGCVLCALAARARVGPRGQLIALGLLGYLFYGYGIYVIERVYNVLYLDYLALFGSTAWLIVLGAVRVARQATNQVSVPRALRRVSAAGALLQPLVFYPLWIGMLIPLMVHRNQIDSLYSIFILDLAFIMPAFLLVAVGLFRTRDWAVALAPVMFVLGAVLMVSLALGELAKPVFGSSITLAGLMPPSLLTTLFVVLAVVYLRRLRLPDDCASPSDTDRPAQVPVPSPTAAMVGSPELRTRTRSQ